MKYLFSIVLIPLMIGSLFSQPTDWVSSGIGGGGSLFYPAISPHNSMEMYIPCDMTNMFHTRDGGKNWGILPFQSLTAIPQSRVGFTSDPAILYALDFNFAWDTWSAVKSVDGGSTWLPLPNSPLMESAFHIHSDINRTDRFIMADWCSIYLTEDGGSSFSSIYSTPGCNPNMWIAGAFFDGDHIYIGTNEGLLFSSDDGQSFSLNPFSGLPSNHGFIGFTGSKTAGQVVLNGVLNPSSDLWTDFLFFDSWGHYDVYQLTIDAGTDWINITDEIIPDNHHLIRIASSQDNTDIIYASGRDVNTSFPVVYKSSDGGTNWESVFLTEDNQNIRTGWSGFQGDHNWWYGEYAWGLAVAPNDPQTIVITDYGFAHVSIDGGNSWHQKYVTDQDENPAGTPTPKGKSYHTNGMENTSAWWLTWTSQDAILASYTDITGTRSEDGGASWSFDYSGNDFNSTYQIIQHPEDNILYAATSSIHDLYQSTYLTDNPINGGEGAILYSIDDGLNWNELNNFGSPVVWLSIDPSDSNTMYASVVNSISGGIYRTTNLEEGTNASWELLPRPALTEGHPLSVIALEDGTVVCSYSGRRQNGFTPSSGIFWWNGTEWQDRSDPGMRYWTKDLVVDPHDSNQNTWYACVHSGWGGAPNNLGGVYKTSDRGITWDRIFNLDRVESITIDPIYPEQAYITTEYEGLFFTDNIQADNPSLIATNYPFQHPMRVFFNPYDSDEIWVTSFGNGLRKGTRISTDIDFVNDSSQHHWIGPNPSNGQLFLDSNNRNIQSLMVYNTLGEQIETIFNPKSNFTLDVPPGAYFVIANDNNGVQLTEKLIISKRE